MYNCTYFTGGDVEGDWRGRSPKMSGWEDSPCISPPNISRITVIECEAKYKNSKKRCSG